MALTRAKTNNQPTQTAADQLEQIKPSAEALLSDPMQKQLEEGRQAAKAHQNSLGTASAPLIHKAYTGDQPEDSVRFQLRNGMIIEMGPPDRPHALVIPKMFKNREAIDDLEDASHFTAAKIMQYVREVNGVRLPGFIGDWQEVVNLMHQLGDIGCRAVYENYQINWPDFGGTYWTELKKNVPGSTV